VLGYAYAAVEGYDYMALRGSAGVLQDVIVDPKHRGRGLGRLLFEAMLTFFRSRGVPRVLLLTARSERGGARTLCERGVPPDDDRNCEQNYSFGSMRNVQRSFWCLLGVYYGRAPERLKRIRETLEKFLK
jgi:hypothetical protein